MNTVFSHQRLDVYKVACEFLHWVYARREIPGHIKQQLYRASDSVVLNIAEGAQQQTLPMMKKHYRVALGSAAECSAALDVLTIRGQRDADVGQQLIGRVGMMLKKLAR